ncbi:MAG UNVERIFIED_CONTAM: hypothetical protein LVT10_02585 [Anaerolineae bacterium]
MGKGVAQDKLAKYIDSMKNARVLPQRIFHSVGRYEAKARFLLPNQLLAKTLNERQDTDYRFVELASGHGLVAFRSALQRRWHIPSPAIKVCGKTAKTGFGLEKSARCVIL